MQPWVGAGGVNFPIDNKERPGRVRAGSPSLRPFEARPMVGSLVFITVFGLLCKHGKSLFN